MKHLERLAYLLILAAVAIYMFAPRVAPWLMAVGALGVLASHLSERYGGNDLRQRRNMKLRWMLGLFYCLTAYYMLEPLLRPVFRPSMDWLPWLCVAVVLEVYTLFVISRRDKEDKAHALAIIITLSLGLNGPASAQAQSLIDGLTQTYELQAQVSDGHTPLWLNANRYGLSTLRSTGGYVRGTVERRLETDSLKHWGVGYGLDLAVPMHYTSRFVVQQCYAEARYKHGVLTLGQKQQPMQLKNQQLSSGSQTLGINARPIPEVRLALDDYWDIPGLRRWLAIKGHASFGWMTDGTFQEEWTGGANRYATGVRYHSKAGYLRIGPDSDRHPFSLELGLEMACQFGGTLYHTQNGTIEPECGMREYVDALFCLGSDEIDATYHNVGGNQLGSWVARLNYEIEPVRMAIYLDHFFEDHSSMFFLDYDGYGSGANWNVKEENRYAAYPLEDILIGTEVELKCCPWVDHVVMEYINTRYQSGPIYHDHNSGINDHIGGDDNYYNHYLYPGWSHWGQVMGNPLYRSPLYNDDHTLLVEDNRFQAWHIGIDGNLLPELRYRVLTSWQEGLGTYQSPYYEKEHNFSWMAEATYRLPEDGVLRGASVRAAIGGDHGRILGNNLGMQLSFIYQINR